MRDVMKYGDAYALEALVRQYALKAYEDLADCGYPEFGEPTRMAIRDTAGDALASDGFDFDRALLRQIADQLA